MANAAKAKVVLLQRYTHANTLLVSRLIQIHLAISLIFSCVCLGFFQGDIIVAETDGDGGFSAGVQPKTAGILQEIQFPC